MLQTHRASDWEIFLSDDELEKHNTLLHLRETDFLGIGITFKPAPVQCTAKMLFVENYK